MENLIEKIEREAVEEARQKADEILHGTREEAASIVEGARAEAEEIIAAARRQTAKFQENAGLSLQQAARDIELLLKERITALFDRAFKREISTALAPDFLKDLILKITGAWAHDARTEITLSDADRETLQVLLLASLGEDFKNSSNYSAHRTGSMIAAGM